ncbi:hypothetical protein E2C01_019547 [Portunus trituberculatus]|uniref:Uncharacterized protein n=1 Tax=Portunus trituberculatus TaxID=210409 RepID=A0A5B7DZ97_PORTR|nr:hypothetical protein [Portunus trituberculatus]
MKRFRIPGMRKESHQSAARESIAQLFQTDAPHWLKVSHGDEARNINVKEDTQHAHMSRLHLSSTVFICISSKYSHHNWHLLKEQGSAYICHSLPSIKPGLFTFATPTQLQSSSHLSLSTQSKHDHHLFPSLIIHSSFSTTCIISFLSLAHFTHIRIKTSTTSYPCSEIKTAFSLNHSLFHLILPFIQIHYCILLFHFLIPF